MSKKRWTNTHKNPQAEEDLKRLESETEVLETPAEDEAEVKEEKVEEKEEPAEVVEEKPKEKKAPKPVKAVVEGDFKNLNVRSTPEVGNNIITELPKGTVVELLEKFDEWSFIRFAAPNGLNGEAYVMTKFLKIKK